MKHPAKQLPPTRDQDQRARVSRVVAIGLFAIALFGLLVLANTLGQRVVEVDLEQTGVGKVSMENQLVALHTTQAGWPWPYLSLQSEQTWPLGYLDSAVAWFSLPVLLLDSLVGLALVVVGTWLFRRWLRARRRLLQFGLLDLGVATALVGLGLAYGLLPHTRHQREAAIVQEILGDDSAAPRYRSDQPRRVVWQPARAAWLEKFVGETWLPESGHAIGANAYGADVPMLVKLHGLSVVRLYGTVSDRQINRLAELPNLACLDISDAMLRKDRGGWLDGPSCELDYPLVLPKLKRLAAANNVLQGRDLAGLDSLEELDLSATRLDGESAATIGGLTHLKILDLHATAIDDRLLAELAGLEQLVFLDISGTKVTDAGLAHLQALPRLETLWASDTAITDKGLASLGRCPRLATIRVKNSQVSRQGVAALLRVRPETLIVP